LVASGLIPEASPLLLILAALVGGVWLVALAVCRPRWLLYAIFALVPSQFLFVPVADFFLSPVDLLVLAGGAGLVLRLAAGARPAWEAVGQHVYLGVMVLAYIVGFMVLGLVSRTLVRVVLAVVPSVLACELLRTRRHLSAAATAIVLAGVVDVGGGLAYYARGIWLHPTRFSGMSGVNFSAIVIAASVVVWYARLARTRRPVSLAGPVVLTGFGLATLSQAGVVALAGAWLAVLRRVFTPANKRRLALAAILVVALALAHGGVREKVFTRLDREVYADGVLRNSTDVRLMTYRAAWTLFQESPVVGVGYFRFAERSTVDPEIRVITAGEGFVSHNVYIEILVEGGLLAFVSFMMHFLQFARGARLAVQAIARRHDIVVAASLAGVPVVLIGAMFHNVLTHYAMWSVCGLGLACLNRLRADARAARVG
jgi:hypothetical protein